MRAALLWSLATAVALLVAVGSIAVATAVAVNHGLVGALAFVPAVFVACLCFPALSWVLDRIEEIG